MKKFIMGYLPEDKPSIGKLLLFAIQQIIVMFPATVLVALLTGFHVSTTIFASGLATLGFIFITKGKIPLYYGSSFSYIAAIVGITGAKFGVPASDLLISQAQFGIIMSGLVSIAAGFAVIKLGKEKIEQILPPTVTGSIAMVIGISLAGVAMTNAFLVGGAPSANAAMVALITLISTIIYSVYLRGIWSQLPILLGILTGYVVAILLGGVDFSPVINGVLIQVPHFTLPSVSWPAVIAIMPIAIATIPESSAHLFQLDIYVNHLADKMGRPHKDIGNRLGQNLIGDGLGDIISASIGGPAGTNYGENLSTMAITNNFSVWVLGAAAILAMILAFVAPIQALVLSVPAYVINGACIYLFGIIAAQGTAIMIEKKVDMFNSKNLAVIATILIIGLGGTFGFANGMIPVFGMQLPAIAAAALFGIVLNLILSFKKD